MNKSGCSIILSRDQVNYLEHSGFLPTEMLAYVLQNILWRSDVAATINLSKNTAEKFREVFTEHLAKVGFDENYDLTHDGEILEQLIDLFSC